MSTASSAPNESTEGTELYSRSTEQPNSSIQYSTQSDAPETTTVDNETDVQLWIFITIGLGACIFVFLIVLIIVCVLKRKGLCCWNRDDITKEHQMVIVHETLQSQPEQPQDIQQEPINKPYKKEHTKFIDPKFPSITTILASNDDRDKKVNSYLKKQKPLPGDVEPYNINTNDDAVVEDEEEIYENNPEEEEDENIYVNYGNNVDNPERNDIIPVGIKPNQVQVHMVDDAGDAGEDDTYYQYEKPGDNPDDEDIYVNDTDKPGYMNSLGGPKIPEAMSSDDEKIHRGDNGVALRKPKRPDHQKTGKSLKAPQKHNSDHGYGNIIGPNSGGITGDSDSQPNYGNISAPGGSNSAQNYTNINAPGGSNAEQNYGNVKAPGEDDMYYNEI